jgi:hypothetical protein
MKKCWANKYSPCNGKLSREHYISKSIFEHQFIYAKGLSWCKNEEKKISIASLTKKVLCEHHNNLLSEIDQAGINSIRLFEQLLPEDIRSTKTLPKSQIIDGLNFERWLLKTAINLTYEGEIHIGVDMTDSKPGQPSPYLLQVVFGDLPFTHKLGLYTLCYSSLEKFRVGSISFTPIHQNNKIAGILFHLRGFDFFLSLYPGHAPPQLSTLGIGDDGKIPKYIAEAIPEYRKEKIVAFNDKNERLEVLFEWKNQPAISRDPTFFVPKEV